MSKLISIFASSKNNIIGDNNQMLWNFKEDFKHFKKITMGYPIIMGRKTFESLPGILPGRIHIVLTRNTEWKPEYESKNDVIVLHSIEDILNIIEKLGYDKNFVIGGGEIYELFEPYVQELIITSVYKDYTGDTSYKPNLKNWDLYKSNFMVLQEQKTKEDIGVSFGYFKLNKR